MKKLLESKKGVTLVSLVITIVVMLILAGVAISAITDGEGLFGRTRQAVADYNKQSAIEKLELKLLELDMKATMDTGKSADLEILEKLIDSSATGYYDKEITNVIVAANGNSAVVEMNGYEITVDSNLNITHIDGSLVTNQGNGSGSGSGSGSEDGTIGDENPGTEDEPTPPTPDTPAVGTENPGTVSGITVKLATGMVPVVYNETDTSWYVATEEQVNNNTWYSYVDTSISGNENASQWANIMLRDNLKVDDNGATVTVTGDTALSDLYGKKVTSMGSMYVWIPRYAYKITNGYHTNTTTGTISVKFLNTNNTYKDGSSTRTTLTDPLVNLIDQNSYKVHPAFTWADSYGNEVALEGLWIGKFEASAADASYTATAPGNVVTSSTVILRSVANVSSWRSINRSNIFSNCYNLNSSTNAGIYGISEDKDEIDPHLIKNTEWGAAAYLAHSQYGRNGVEVTINANSSYLTGSGNYITNTNMSTTGNVYGIYDMSGGSWEHIAAYINNSNGNLTTNGSALVADIVSDKYRDVYNIGVTDDYQLNYARTAETFGDALFETSGAAGYWNSNGNAGYYYHGWNGDHTMFPYGSYPFFYRGGNYLNGSRSRSLRFR